MELPRRCLPDGAWVKQRFPDDHVSDVRGETHRQVAAALSGRVRAGQRIAITAGSRGIGGDLELLSGIAGAVRERGAEPFIVPAMGSHGGATAEGQTEILRRLGVTESAVGAKIVATMETRELGKADNGAVAHVDRHAAESDGIIVLGRVKTHPESATRLASGLLKMVTVGLGKQRGAAEAHHHGLWSSVEAVPRVVLARAPVLLGVAVVENAYRRPLAIEVVPADHGAFLEADQRLLRLASAHLAKLPFDDLDLLVVDEIGKNVSGTGMDTNVVGTWRFSGGAHVPDYRRIAVLSLTVESLGNGLGIGMAACTTRRFADAFDPVVTAINALTASEPRHDPREASVPLTLPSDREAVEVALHDSLAGEAPRVCRIKNTASLADLWVSEALFEEVGRDPRLSRVGEAAALPFDTAGNLL